MRNDLPSRLRLRQRYHERRQNRLDPALSRNNFAHRIIVARVACFNLFFSGKFRRS